METAWTGWLLVALVAVGTLLAIRDFIKERAWRAVAVAVFFCCLLLGPMVVLLVSDIDRGMLVLGTGVAIGLIAVVLLPRWGNRTLGTTSKPQRVDERDAVFHRFYRLQPGTPEYDQYYSQHPNLKKFDDALRNLPELGEVGSPAYHPINSAFQLAAVAVMARQAQDLDGEWSSPSPVCVDVDAADITDRLKGFARYLGADLVGCCHLRPEWVYSHIGRGEGRWGQALEIDHENAIVVACRMDWRMVGQAPRAATTTETAIRYLQVGNIALVLARAIQLMGYRARAHVDGNYRLMCVPVAVDAGLGELGRMGLLITPELGPRVRLAVVSTDLPLKHDSRRTFGVADFCRKCSKCARACPSGSVDRGEPRLINGSWRWQTRRDTCYRAWRRQGTDCNVCVRVCPYSHPRGGIHRPVRWLASRNPWARRLMLWADDLFYGRKPGSKVPPPPWHRD